MAGTAPQIREITTDEKPRIVSVDFSSMLGSGELLAGAPTIQGSDDLTITDEQVNASAVTINGISVADGKAVQFKVETDVAGQYKIEILCGTDAGQVLEGAIRLNVRASSF